ncbi:MAG: hypothetical protein B7Y84_14835, partial [Azorhizobium sp. 32-67-21]
RRANQRAAEEIVRAIWDDRICLALQPVVDIATRQIVFHEALARIAPVPGIAAKDMPHVAEAAERLGLIGALDRQVLALAIRALRRDPALRLSVNVSPLSVADHGWQQVFAAEATADIAPRLILELTESAVVQDLDAARSFVRLARERGAQVAIDDFGAGSTSFRNLRSLGVDMVKIDGSFMGAVGRRGALSAGGRMRPDPGGTDRPCGPLCGPLHGGCVIAPAPIPDRGEEGLHADMPCHTGLPHPGMPGRLPGVRLRGRRDARPPPSRGRFRNCRAWWSAFPASAACPASDASAPQGHPRDAREPARPGCPAPHRPC